MSCLVNPSTDCCCIHLMYSECIRRTQQQVCQTQNLYLYTEYQLQLFVYIYIRSSIYYVPMLLSQQTRPPGMILMLLYFLCCCFCCSPNSTLLLSVLETDLNLPFSKCKCGTTLSLYSVILLCTCRLYIVEVLLAVWSYAAAAVIVVVELLL